MEHLDVVNEKDEIIGKASREECHKDPELIHRAANIYIFNSDNLNYILRVKRACSVDTEDSKWTILVGEHNQLGEDYESAIRRGVKEEIGIENLVVKRLGEKVIRRMKNQTEIHQNFIGIYSEKLGDLTLDTNEIEKVEFISVSELLKDIKTNKSSYVSYIESALKLVLEKSKCFF
ncbi:NUDIX domain-containing protein [archaeon]|nr:NUDIX domain-containing protein [archaeon]